MKLYLIVEYGGRLAFNGWYLPDHHHGGIYAGPYSSPEEASAALQKYAEKQGRYDVFYFGERVVEEQDRQSVLSIQREISRVVDSHRIIEVSWPDERHPDDPEA